MGFWGFDGAVLSVAICRLRGPNEFGGPGERWRPLDVGDMSKWGERFGARWAVWAWFLRFLFSFLAHAVSSRPRYLRGWGSVGRLGWWWVGERAGRMNSAVRWGAGLWMIFDLLSAIFYLRSLYKGLCGLVLRGEAEGGEGFLKVGLVLRGKRG